MREQRPVTAEIEADTPGSLRDLDLVPAKRNRLSDQLYGQILDHILSSRIKEGDRLPSENEIGEMFGASRPIVREALMRLRADGLILSRQGKGTFVVSRPVERMVSFATTEDVARFLSCLEVRLPLEGTSAKLAAERRTPEQMERIKRTGAVFQAEMEAGGATAKSDLAFHLAVAEATGSVFFSRVLRGLGDELSGFMRLSLNLTRTGSKERARRVLEEHTRIVEAIRNQDGEGAAFAMQFHISEARRRLINRNREPQA